MKSKKKINKIVKKEYYQLYYKINKIDNKK